MKRNRVTSTIQVVIILITIPLIIISAILYLVAWRNSGIELQTMFLVVLLICLSMIVLSMIINIISLNFGKRRIIISYNKINYMNKDYEINKDTRLIYSKINLGNILEYNCPGGLILIINGQQIKLGSYFMFEIKKMLKFIPIKMESKIIR